MEKKYISTVSRVPATPRSKRRRAAGASASSGASSAASAFASGEGAGAQAAADGHSHANKADLDRLGTDEDGYVYVAVDAEAEDGEITKERGKAKSGYADEAGHASKAHDLDDDSPAREEFLSRRKPDTAMGRIAFADGLDAEREAALKEGAQFGADFVGGAQGVGGRIDGNADAELRSLRLRQWLEVPELRYNRAEVIMGDQWRAPGGGVVERAEPDFGSDGAPLPSGTAWLKLEEGEIGAVAKGDICKGYFHDFARPGLNAAEDADDGRGNTAFAGFRTVFFTVTEVADDGGACRRFRYALRPGTEAHPYEAMNFVAYGSFEREDRRTSAYETRAYSRCLAGVDDWEFRKENVAMQMGDLSNLAVFGLDMKGYSAYLNNIYMSGTIEQFSPDAPARLEVESAGGVFLGPGESVALSARAFRGWADVTEDVEQWSVTRSRPGIYGDAGWAEEAAGRLQGGRIAIGYADLYAEGPTSIDFLAKGAGLEARGSVALYRKPEDGKDGAPGADGSSYSANLMANTKERITKTYASDGDHATYLYDRTVHLENGETYTISAITNAATFSSDITVNGADKCVLLLFDLVTGVGSGLYKVVSHSDMATDGSKGHTFVWNKPTGDYGLRIGFFKAGTWYVEKVKVERGTVAHPQWTPAEDEMVGKPGEPGKDGADGKDGPQGPAGPRGASGIDGMVTRTTEWEDGKEYRNDRALTQGVRYLDVAVLKGAKGEFESAWVCMRTHASSDGNRPGTDGGSAYWQRMNSMQPIATPLILAENSVISFMQGNSLRVYDSAGSLVAGIAEAATPSEPVIYAGAGRRPVSAAPLFLASASSASPEIGDAAWGYGIPAWSAAKPYLHVKIRTAWSDGTVSDRYGGNAADDCAKKIAQERWPSEFRVYYEARVAGKPTDFDYSAPERHSAWPALTAGAGSLQARVRAMTASGLSTWFSLADCGKWEPSESPLTGAMQVLPSGEAWYGDRTGAAVHIIPSHDGGLPRIECSDREGNVTVRLEAADVSSADELFGSAAESAEAALPSGTALADARVSEPEYSQAETGEASATFTLPFSSPAAGTAVVKPFTLELTMEMGGTSRMPPVRQWAEADAWVDGVRIASWREECRWNDETGTVLTPSQGESSAAEWLDGYYTYGRLECPGASAPVGAGDHSLQIRLKAFGYAADHAGNRQGAFHATLRSQTEVRAQWRGQKKMARYFANGFAVGDATDNYCMAAVIDGEQVLRASNRSGVKFEMDARGVRISKDGRTLDLTSLIPAAAEESTEEN